MAWTLKRLVQPTLFKYYFLLNRFKMMADMKRNQDISTGSGSNAADGEDNDGSDDDGPPPLEDTEISK